MRSNTSSAKPTSEPLTPSLPCPPPNPALRPLMPALPRPSQVDKLLSKLKLCNNATDMDTLFNMMDRDGSGGCRAAAARSPAALTAAELCRRLAEPERILDCRRPSDRGGGRERGHPSVPQEDRLRRSATRCRAGGAMALTAALLGAGTRWRNSANIAWCTMSMVGIIAVGVVYNLLQEFKSILAPAGMAYFFVLLLQPIVDLLEQRPLALRGWLLCAHNKDYNKAAEERVVCSWRSGDGVFSECCNATSRQVCASAS